MVFPQSGRGAAPKLLSPLGSYAYSEDPEFDTGLVHLPVLLGRVGLFTNFTVRRFVGRIGWGPINLTHGPSRPQSNSGVGILILVFLTYRDRLTIK